MFDYRVISIEEVPTQQHRAPGPWYCYVIASEIHTIVGYHRGSRQATAEYAAQCVDRLQARHRQPPRFTGSSRLAAG